MRLNASAVAGPGAAAGHRLLGARILPAVQERAAGLREEHLDCGQLEERGRALCGSQGHRWRSQSAAGRFMTGTSDCHKGDALPVVLMCP